MTAGRLASERLIAEKEELARALTERLYGEMPDLLHRYGPAGREKCLQDMRYNLEHLAPAVDLEEPGMFAAYVGWLDDLLRARGVASAEVVRTLELMETLLQERFDAHEAGAAVPCVRAGLDALRQRRGAL